MFERPYIQSPADQDMVGLALNLRNRVAAFEAETLWIDGLLSEALDESFPASDPISSLMFD